MRKKDESGETMTAELKKNNLGQPTSQEQDIYTHPLRRSWFTVTVICCTSSVFVGALITLILVLTVFKPYKPTITLLSVNFQGFTPTISVPADGHVHINVTVDLDLLVYNPNGAQFNHDKGYTRLSYRGSTIGDAEVDAGKIPAKESEHVSCRVLVVGTGFVGKMNELLADVGKGVIGFDTSMRIKGEIVLVGFLRRSTIAASNCHFLARLPEFEVKQQQCVNV